MRNGGCLGFFWMFFDFVPGSPISHYSEFLSPTFIVCNTCFSKSHFLLVVLKNILMSQVKVEMRENGSETEGVHITGKCICQAQLFPRFLP